MGSLIKELPRFEKHDRSCMLKERLRQALIDQAETGNPTTYKELADRLGLEPPQTIHRIGVRHSRPSWRTTSPPVARCWLHFA